MLDRSLLEAAMSGLLSQKRQIEDQIATVQKFLGEPQPQAGAMAQVGVLPRKRGRPPKNPLAINPVAGIAPVMPPRKRGRPPKNPQAVPMGVAPVIPPRKRGRPPKNPQALPVATVPAPAPAPATKRVMSPEGRLAVAAATKKRWDAFHKANPAAAAKKAAKKAAKTAAPVAAAE